MFDRAVAALKAAEQAIVADLDQLWVPFDPATGNGGLHWHGAGAGALIESYKSVVGLRANLEAKEPPVPAAESVTPEEVPVADETVPFIDTAVNTNPAEIAVGPVENTGPEGGTIVVTPEPEPITVEPEPELAPEPAEAPAEESVTEVEDGA